MGRMRILKVTKLPKDKDLQVDITVREMINLTCTEAWAKPVQWLCNNARLIHYDRAETADAYCQFVRRRVQFELDPRDIELLRLPSWYATQIRAGLKPPGDCDDMALLLGTMFFATGIRTAYVVMATSPTNKEFRHVFVAGQIGRDWRCYDPSVEGGYDTKDFRRRWYYVPFGVGPEPTSLQLGIDV